jgi:uncharacterized OB-fold protein
VGSARAVALATYRPVWEAGPGGRSCGPDEDAATLAVCAAWPLVDEGSIERVVLVTRSPDFLEPGAGPVLLAALGLPRDVRVEERLGGGPAALAALCDASAGTLVIAVSPEAPAGAAAVLTGVEGVEVSQARAAAASLPVRVRAVAGGVSTYDDARLLRERGTGPAVAAVTNGAPPAAVTGVPPGELRRLGVDGVPQPVGGAAEPFFALAELVAARRSASEAPRSAGGEAPRSGGGDASRSVLLVAAEGASATAVSLGDGDARVLRVEREAIPVPVRAEPLPARIPVSLPAYARAFDAKVGLKAGRCACGSLAYPPRVLCLECGRSGELTPEDLPRTGEVYSTVTIRTPVPGIPGPYSLAIVALDGVDVRILVHVTGAPAGSVGIGERGGLVFRRIALRDGVPDYGYAFETAS